MLWVFRYETQNESACAQMSCNKQTHQHTTVSIVPSSFYHAVTEPQERAIMKTVSDDAFKVILRPKILIFEFNTLELLKDQQKPCECTATVSC